MLSAPASYQHDMRLRTANQISCTVHVFTGVSSYVLCALIHSQMMQGRKDHHDLGLIVATAEIPLQIALERLEDVFCSAYCHPAIYGEKEKLLI
jgi:hypothetical protein